MSAPGELITLQFGPAANAAGAHLWNIQDELLGLEAGASGGGTPATAAAFESGVLWAEGRGETAASAPTYTPRLLIFDERESLGGGCGVFGAGGASWPANGGGAWTGGVTHVSPPPPTPSPWAAAISDGGGAADLASAAAALSLDGGVRAWPDYLKAPIPRTALAPVAPARPPRCAAPGWGPPGGEGEAELAATASEGVRRLAEACDRLAGVALLVDDTGGWGAAAAAALAGLEDGGCLGRRPARLVAAVRPAGWWEGDAASASARTAAAAASAAFLAPAAHVYIPFDLPAGTGGTAASGPASAQGLFRSGAAVAAAWDGLTTPVRLRRAGPASATGTGALDIDALASLVAGPSGRGRWGAVAVGLPAVGGGRPGPLPAAPPAARPPPFTASTVSWTARIPPPDGSRARALLAESVVWRGPAGHGGAPLALAAASAELDAALGSEAVADASTAAGGVAVRHRCVALQPLPLPLPWPAGFPAGLAPGAAGAPLLTRLRAVRGVRAAVAAAAKDFAAAGATSAGRVALGPAGADADALAEGLEVLREGGGGAGSSSEDGWESD